jgi:hypothetical protein
MATAAWKEKGIPASSDAGLDGVLFQSLGLDAKGGCYVKTLTPKGQEESVRKLPEIGP